MTADIQSIIKQMTLEEKAALCTGASAWTTTPIERLGVPQMWVSDGPHGVRRVADLNSVSEKSLPATCFPTASCLASTWDLDIIGNVGEALGEECLGLGVDVLLGPGNNMKRTPLGGRNFEYFSEDPYLAGEIAAKFISGVQSKGVGTSLKHYAVNNQEYRRFSISAEVDERTLHETYLAGFEKAVKQGKPWTVMCAYNKLNGTYCSEHHELLVDILKDDWGFEGLVMSDWGAVHNRVASLKGGLDLEMPGPKAARVQAVVDAVRGGELDEAILDESVRRILGIVFKAARTPKNQSFDAPAHHKLARKVATEGMVLLKNNGILPLKNLQHVAVIGHSAENAHFQGGGSSHINPTQVDVPFTELQKLMPDAELSYAPGYGTDQSFHQGMIDQAVVMAQAADVALLYIALPTYKESEGYDRPDLDLTPQQIALIKAVSKSQPNTVVVLNNGAAVTMSEWIDDVAAVIETWMMGQAGGGAIADVLTGKVNPSGKLAETFPLRLEDTPAFINFPGENGKVHYGEGIYIGYRYYDAKGQPVLFPFGYGLSYTTFEFTGARLSADTFTDTEGVTVSVDVKNTGSVAGKEVVQVYVHDVKASVHRPVKELKGFAKVELAPGETKTVEIHLDARAFAFYDAGYHQWVAESGEFEILVGASSADIRHTLKATLNSTQKLPFILHEESTIGDWLTDPRGKIVFEPFYQQMKQQMAALFGGESQDSIGMDTMSFLFDMPVVSVLHFNDRALEKSPETIVAELLEDARKLD